MRTLVTGADGFIGGWLSKLLVAAGDEVFALSRREDGAAPFGATRLRADLRDQAAIRAAVEKAKPERVFHLAALNHIPTSFHEPEETFAVNVFGTMHLLDAARDVSPGSVFVSVGSGSEYGETARQQSTVAEGDPLVPTSPYGISKVAQGLYTRLAAKTHGLRTVHARPFAILGPGKRGDALTQFAEQVVHIEKGDQKDMLVGNLEAVRDFVDVRDCARALVLLAEKGASGEAYNVSSGAPAAMSDLVALLRASAKRPFELVVDPARLRPIDDLRIVGSPAKLAALGFQRAHDLAKTVGDTLAALRDSSRN